MSSETDHPRQRTVAELLAEHGDGAATGRRRRRRAADGPPEEVEPAEPDRSVLREPVPYEPAPYQEPYQQVPQGAYEPAPYEPVPYEPAPYEQAPYEPVPYDSTAYEQAPHEPPPYDRAPYRPAYEPAPFEDGPRDAAAYPPDPHPTSLWDSSPVTHVDRGYDDRGDEPGYDAHGYEPDYDSRAPAPPAAPPGNDRRAGPGGFTPPATRYPDPLTDEFPVVRGDSVGRPAAPDVDEDRAAEDAPAAPDEAPAGGSIWQRARGAVTRRRTRPDGGPPTEASAPLDLDDPEDGPEDGPDDRYALGPPGRARSNHPDDDSDDRRMRPAGIDLDERTDLDERADLDPDAPAAAPRPWQRFGLAALGPSGQAWAVVLGQWVAGALGGAVVWVGFRFLWRSLPVVALAAAVLVTVGLVVVVRALLRNDDLRTTVFAVLVGLLLTVSPAILVLLDR